MLAPSPGPAWRLASAIQATHPAPFCLRLLPPPQERNERELAEAVNAPLPADDDDELID